MFGYLNHVFLELHYRFHSTLIEASGLVISGYSFGDKGINSRLTDYMCLPVNRGEKKVVLIDPRPLEEVEQSARGAIAGKLMAWRDDGRLVHLRAGIESEDVTWARVSDELLSQ